MTLTDLTEDAVYNSGIGRRAGAGAAPLSFAQELLWLMDRASPGTSVWNVPRAFRVRGRLDAAALQRALAALCRRHESLRTVFTATPVGPRQIAVDAEFALSEVDLSGHPEPERARRSKALLRDHAERPFDLSCDLLLRAGLVTLGPDDRILWLTSHHIVSDGWSKSVLFAELSALYAEYALGRPARLEPLPIQFSDYAAWERDPAREADVAESLAYWRDRLARLAPLALSHDFAPLARASHDGARAVLTVPPAVVETLAALSRAHGVTPYMTLLAGYAVLLHRYAGQDDVAIGSPIAARVQPETEGLIGYLADTLVLRCRLDGDPTFAELLARVRETCLEAYDHQEIPFERLVLDLQKDRELSYAPLFSALLTMEDTVPADLRLGEAVLEPLEMERGQIKVDLTLLAARRPEGLRLALWYRTDLFAAATAERMLRHLQTLLEAAVAAPATRVSALPLLSAVERAFLTEGVNGPGAAYTGPLVPARFAEAALAAPSAEAVVCGAVRLSYGEMAAGSAALGQRLRALGAGPGAVVGICLERSAEFVTAMLGVWASGAAYVPLPPDLPAVRLADQLAQCGARLVVTAASYRELLPAAATAVLVDAAPLAGPEDGAEGSAAYAAAASLVRGESPAYVLFTSGSTGSPKGVVVTHGNLANYTQAIELRLEIGAERLRYAALASPGADLGYTATFPSLCTGGTLHVIPADVAQDAARFAEALAASPVDVLKITPSHLRALLEGSEEGAVLPRRSLVLGGEACSWELVARVRARGACAVLNHYGPTETTVGACSYLVGETPEEATPSGTVPLGRPLSNVRCYVLDARGEPVPLGVAGELYVGGAGVAAGYANRPELTAERFEADPFSPLPSARRYRTGDRVRRLASGDLEFLGRLDDQVKVRGFRVEPGEIESVLRQYPGIREAAVVVRERGGEPDLAGYVAGEGARDEGLRAWLAARLPDYMLPRTLTAVDAFALTPSGKLDRSALPDPEAESAGEAAYAAPRTATEAALAQIWGDVLHRERVSVEDDFLSLGFHSILAIRALGKLSRAFGVRLPLRTLFDAPTIARLAAVVDAEREAAEERDLEAALAALDALPAGRVE